jgi:hypothetical protein
MCILVDKSIRSHDYLVESVRLGVVRSCVHPERYRLRLLACLEHVLCFFPFSLIWRMTCSPAFLGRVAHLET